MPGTINALVVTYYTSDEWQRLAADTQKKRRRIIEGFRAEHGDKRVALLRREHILKMLAAIDKPSPNGMAEGHSRPAAGRRPEHAPGQSDRGHRRHQDAQEQGTSQLDR